jgi:antagonist of KipI
MSMIIERPAALMSVQDLGRTGYARFGLPESGPMDWWAHRAANRLVGNPVQAACLEIGFTSAVIKLNEDSLLAVCGAGYQVTVNSRPIPLWVAFLVRRGDKVVLEKIPGGNWVYLSTSGGLDTAERLGSRSSNPRAGLGEILGEGDILRVLRLAQSQVASAGSSLPEKWRPDYRENPILRTISGPHSDRFTPESLEAFWHSEYLLTSRSDRMGFRLSGGGVCHVRGADLISQGMALGEIQVPGDGQPIVMMPDHPTTGGYTCIGTVIRCDLPLLAQAPLAEARIRFIPFEVDQAQMLLRTVVHQVDTGIQHPEEEWLQW